MNAIARQYEIENNINTILKLNSKFSSFQLVIEWHLMNKVFQFYWIRV